MDLEFFICPVCGKLYAAPSGMGVGSCCGKYPERIQQHNAQGAPEKHLPVTKPMREGITVTVGAQEHPMDEDHYISHIALLTDQGYWVSELAPGAIPSASFELPDGDMARMAYAYCNKHGLWATPVTDDTSLGTIAG